MKYISLFCLLFLVGCNQNTKKENVKNELPEIQIKGLDLDSVYCEFIDASYVGSLQWSNDTLFYIDEKFCAVFAFNTQGEFLQQFLSQGSGPNELATRNIVGYSRLDNGGHFFLGPSNDCYVFNQQMNKTKFFIITKNSSQSEISYDSPYCYTLSYPKLILRNYGDMIYSNVYCEHPKLHMFTSYKKYVDNAHFLASINIKSGEMENLYGNYSLAYKKDNTKQFSLVSYDIDKEGNFYVCLEADSLIHFYNSSFELLYSFGYKGQEMSTEYSNLHTIKDFRHKNLEEREKYSYYTWIEYVDERNLLFRSYKKQNSMGYDGLQIYKNNTLIGDVYVPKNFRVVGYSSPYFYGVVPVDEDKETIKFYKFKL